jgi:glucokinase
MTLSASSTLLADIGATNARFALLTDGVLGEPSIYPVADYGSPVEAAQLFLAGRRPSAAIIAAAGPVLDGRVLMVNADWTVDATALRDGLGLETVRVINDFEAQARALPALGAADLFPVGRPGRTDQGTMLVTGPGTGFGVAGLARGPGGEVALVTEGGHATLPAEDRREEDIIRFLRGRLGHVSVERVLSGAGLVDLYHAVGMVDGLVIRERTGPAILAHALAGDCEASVATLEAFCAFLGAVAGNLALTFGATGGVFIGGGITPRFPDFLAASAFRARFEAKGRLRPYLERIPTAIVIHPNPAFLGLRRMAAEAAR